VDGLVEAASCELGVDHSLRSCLRVLDVEIEQAQVKVTGFGRRTKNRSPGWMERIEEQPEFERVTLGLPGTVDGRILLAEWTASGNVVAKSTEQPVEHPFVTLSRCWHACRSVHCGQHWLKDPGQYLAVCLCLETHSVDHNVEDA
jgi:hypothetical protein